VTVHEGLIVPSRSPKAKVKSRFYFCFSSSGGYEKINAREEFRCFEYCCEWKLSKGKRLNVSVSLFLRTFGLVRARG